MNEQMGRPSLKACVLACFDNQDFMREYRRLSSSRFGLGASTPLERMIDDVTGAPSFSGEEAMAFIAFVIDVVWSRLEP